MTLDCWLVDIAVKQNKLQGTGNEGHSVLKIFLLTVPLILHIFFPSYKLQHIPIFIFFVNTGTKLDSVLFDG